MLQYRTARSALLAANFRGQNWQDRLKDLKDSDVCGPGKDNFYLPEPGKANYGASKGHYEIFGCNEMKGLRSFSRRCNELLFTMNGSNSDASNKIPSD